LRGGEGTAFLLVAPDDVVHAGIWRGDGRKVKPAGMGRRRPVCEESNGQRSAATRVATIGL
jgi:hypothetical protein